MKRPFGIVLSSIALGLCLSLRAAKRSAWFTAVATMRSIFPAILAGMGNSNLGTRSIAQLGPVFDLLHRLLSAGD